MKKHFVICVSLLMIIFLNSASVGFAISFLSSRKATTRNTLSFLQDKKNRAFIMQQKVEQLVAAKNELDKIIAEKQALGIN